MKLDSEEFLRQCADTYYRGEGYVPVGVPALDTRAFYDVLRRDRVPSQRVPVGHGPAA